jgi:hypothetical protein
VHVFERQGTTWTAAATLAPSITSDTWFGRSLAVSGDTVIVGAPLYSTASCSYCGAVLASFRSGGVWGPLVLIQQAAPADGANFGRDVALEGGTAAIGAVDGSGGGAFAFDLSDGTATELGHLRPRYPNPGLSIDSVGALGIRGDLVIAGGANASVIFSLVPPAPVAYCTAKVNSQGCVPAMTFQGDASATSASPFLVGATNVLSHKFGMLFFGVSGRTAFPFQGGTLCVLPPIRRTVTQDSGGNPGEEDCSGSYSLDFNALVQSGAHSDLIAGVLVDCQYWSRDPASPSTVGLTNAVEFGIGF